MGVSEAEPRFYRNHMSPRRLIGCRVRIRESDLIVFARRDVSNVARGRLMVHRSQLEAYIDRDPGFLRALKPLLPLPGAPPVVAAMIAAGEAAGVGPMAAVAGAIAQAVGRDLLAVSDEVIVENGGDIFLATRSPRLVAIWAGDSPYSWRTAIEITAADSPAGVSTSSGKLGHSLSFGRADAAVAIARDAALADAAATALGNLVRSPADIPAALDLAASIPGLRGCVLIAGERLGAWGAIRLVETGGTHPNVVNRKGRNRHEPAR